MSIWELGVSVKVTSLRPGKRQSQTLLMQIEAIYFPGYSSKITNHNIQITNNIKITNTNDQNISITYWIIRRHSICFEF